jgi:hypothetical protein
LALPEIGDIGCELVLLVDGELRKSRLFKAHGQAELGMAIAETRAARGTRLAVSAYYASAGVPCARTVLLAAVLFSTASVALAQAPRLGDPVESTRKRWGEPVRAFGGDLLDFDKCPGRTAVARYSIMAQDDRIVAITRNACAPETLAPEGALREARLFMPADAQPGGAFTTNDGWPARTYRSPALARLLPASRFRDCSGRPVPPGTLSYLLSPERRSWMVVAGKCP